MNIKVAEPLTCWFGGESLDSQRSRAIALARQDQFYTFRRLAGCFHSDMRLAVTITWQTTQALL